MVIAKVLSETIHKKYHLRKKGGKLFLENNVRIQDLNKEVFGFYFDCSIRTPFPFLNKTPPYNIAKMCDAVISLNLKEKIYIFIVAQKTKNIDEYQAKIVNGKLFCDWLFSLFREHGYLKCDPVYIGLLIREPRKQPRKGCTSQKFERYAHEIPVPGIPFRVVEIKNNRLVHLQGILKTLNCL